MKTSNSKLTPILFSASILAGALPLTSSAEVLYFENFESYTPGSAITSASPYWSSTTNTNDVYFEAHDSGDYFGADNQYGYIADTSVTNNQNMSDATSSFTGTYTGQIDLDFYDASDDLFNGAGFILRFGTGDGNTKTSFGIYIQNGEIMKAYGQYVTRDPATAVTYDMDTANTLSIVFNNTDESMIYAGGSIAAYSMDVYLNGVQIAHDWGTAGEDPAGSLIQMVNFNAKRSANSESDFAGTLYLDNLKVSSDISIPEPSSSYMLIAGLAGMLIALRKRLLKQRS
ncbi:PEP-CTERM sorting domain-containing protein [Ruficoccus sp. ZRK36]|uniref:PEP-CTERM sorting domain-containing protein n=1 Tax=Ruficoccus sp. ZRK36 TaxID=2866311 RepID=UPI001C72FF1A|nr:PEP-CTERM sorting domain-containing protein [Ruficoccus sp. ZRK36]QYY35022.1 PEP-CTERM sorting domain-containing protein [Ruficoccus sp. ZRK36]